MVRAAAKWAWAWYEVLTLWQWLTGLPFGGVVWAMLATTANWPLWVQALISLVIAFIWLTALSGVVRMFSRPSKKDQGSQSQDNSPGAQQAESGRDTYQAQAGHDVIINPVPEAQVKPHWLHRSGCPQFEMHPGIQNPTTDRPLPQIGGDCYIWGANPLPNNIEVRWEGPGIEMDWKRPVSTHTTGRNQIGFHMGWTTFDPAKRERVECKFHVRFWWDNEEHGATWIWPVVPHSTPNAWEGRWREGSHVFQPRLEDTW